ncbi:unnamed protein product [Dicrocoelium dendriticum]|nr:unnamed protein product [Dicrocoelium dendriticum]
MLLRELVSGYTSDDSRLRFSEALNDLCVQLFPHRWKPSRKRPLAQTIRNSKQRRRLQYGHIQRLYYTRRKDAAATIINGRWRIAFLQANENIPDFNDFWKSVLNRPPTSDPRPPRQVVSLFPELVRPISCEEMKQVLKQMQGPTLGIDRFTPAEVNRMDPQFVTSFLNCLLASCPFPSHMNDARITFVPKIQQPRSPDQFRPISVSSVFTRLLHRILFDRWVPAFPTDRLQFGFLRKDGAFEAPSILHAALRYSHTSITPLSFVSVDVSKAFDSICHQSLLRAAAAFGAPQFLIDYLASYYLSAYSIFSDIHIHPNRAVRQGDPLSPLLFIMALDEVLEGVATNPWKSPAGPISYLAYADDVIIFAEDRLSLKEHILEFQKRLQDTGLAINHLKSFAVNIVADRARKKTMLDISELNCDGFSIKSIQPTEQFTMLGLKFNWKGRCRQQL